MDQLPISYNGKIKLGYIRQWTSVRNQIENNFHPDPNIVSYTDEIIEYPQPSDVVFRQGSSCDSHPANREFRNLIREKVEEQEKSMQATGKTKIRRKKMVLDIVSETRIKHGGRFLIWNEMGGWNELRDDDLIHAKIEYLIKEFRKSLRSRRNFQSKIVLQADTSMFRSNYNFQTDDLQQHNPFDLSQQVDDKQLLEAVSCLSSCFDMEMKDANTTPSQTCVFPS